MANQVNFEVQVLQNERWSIHARYPNTGKDEAIDEAKQLTGQGMTAMVIRDVYDTEKNVSHEFIIYASPKAKGKLPTRDNVTDETKAGPRDEVADLSDEDIEEQFGEDAEFFVDDDDLSAVRRQRKKKKKKPKKRDDGDRQPTSLVAVVVKMLMVVLFSVILAAAATTLGSLWLDQLNLFGVKMVGGAKEKGLLIIFFGTFALSALLITVGLLRGSTLKTRNKRQSKRAERQAQRAAARAAAAAQSARSGAPLPSQPGGYEAANDTDGNEMDRFREAAEAARAESEAEPEGTEPEAVEEPIQENPRDDKPPDDADEFAGIGMGEDMDIADALSPHGEKQKSYMMGFVKSALESTGADNKKMSNFEKFGVSLFFAGACEALSEKRELDEAERSKIMSDSVQTMGFKKSHAINFADRYQEYLMQDASYMQMFQSGRNAMSTYFTEPEHIGKNLNSALEQWKKPKQKEQQMGPVTVLFTDIAGSTAMTQTLGDAGAQQVVRAHNRVVREALSMWNGREIKHTGDGIMASFAKTSDSLDAAIQIQRETAQHNMDNPDLPLHIKIGINSGEPIAEDNDLFGSTVQMSARIVDKAKADQIFVSEIVRGICAGKSYKFVNKGPFKMKGFDQDPLLYEVVWQEDEQPAETREAASG